MNISISKYPNSSAPKSCRQWLRLEEHQQNFDEFGRSLCFETCRYFAVSWTVALHRQVNVECWLLEMLCNENGRNHGSNNTSAFPCDSCFFLGSLKSSSFLSTSRCYYLSLGHNYWHSQGFDQTASKLAGLWNVCLRNLGQEEQHVRNRVGKCHPAYPYYAEKWVPVAQEQWTMNHGLA